MENFIVPGLEVEGKEMKVPHGTLGERPPYTEGLFWGNADLGIGQIALGGRWIYVGGLTLSEEIIASTTPDLNSRHPVNSENGPITLTLRDDAPVGAQIALFDSGSSWDSNTVTLTSSELINTSNADIELTAENGGATLIFLGEGKGWYLIGSTSSGSGSGSGFAAPTFVSDIFTADHDKAYFINLTHGSSICTLPDFKVGKTVILNDHYGLCSELNPILITSADNLHGKDEDIILDRKNVSVILQCIDEVQGWKIISGVGLELVEVTGAGIQRDYRLSCLDSFGHTAFIDGFKPSKIAGTTSYKITEGFAYVGGLRATMDVEQIKSITELPSNIYLEVHREGTALGEWDNIAELRITGENLSDYVNEQGITVYLAKIASINNSGVVTDLRDVHTGAFQRASNHATTDDMDNRSTEKRHINLAEFWYALDKEIGDLSTGTSKAYLLKTGTAANSNKLGGIDANKFARLDKVNVMTTNFQWKAGENYKGFYWGNIYEDSNGHTGSNAFFRQGVKNGTLEMGVDDSFNIFDTDSGVAAISVSTKNKTLNAKGYLMEAGIRLSNIYLGKKGKADNSALLDGHAASYFAKSTDVKTPVPIGAKFTDTYREITDSVASDDSTIAASAAAVKKAYDKANVDLSSDHTSTSTTLSASLKAVNNVWTALQNFINSKSSSVVSDSTNTIATSKAVKIVKDRAEQIMANVSNSYSSQSTSVFATSKAVNDAYNNAKTVVNSSLTSTSKTDAASAWAVRVAYNAAVAAQVTKSNSVSSSSTTTVATSYAVKAAYDKAKANAVVKSSSYTSTSKTTVATSYAVQKAYDRGTTFEYTSLYVTGGSSGLDAGTITLSIAANSFDFLIVLGTNDSNKQHKHELVPMYQIKKYTYGGTYPYRFYLFADHGSYWIVKTSNFKTLYAQAENSRIRAIYGLNLH